jgi:hypothetical protein
LLGLFVDAKLLVRISGLHYWLSAKDKL